MVVWGSPGGGFLFNRLSSSFATTRATKTPTKTPSGPAPLLLEAVSTSAISKYSGEASSWPHGDCKMFFVVFAERPTYDFVHIGYRPGRDLVGWPIRLLMCQTVKLCGVPNAILPSGVRSGAVMAVSI